ncbi:MAG: nitroreductase family protein [Beijerinckiaceae bacterium]
MSKLAKPAVTARPLHDVIGNRWSPRSFADRPVSKDDLVAVLEAARWAASCNNAQPWRFLVATKDDTGGYEAALAGFNARNQRWAKTAPVLIFGCARKTFEANGNPNNHAWYDLGAAVAQLTAQASALGLVVHQAAGIERETVRKTFNVPDEFDIVVGFTLGYQGDPDALPEELPGREREPRARKPLGEIVFAGSFGATAPYAK